MIGDGFPLCYKRHPIHLTYGERVVVWSLLKAYPDHVTKSTLLDRLDSDGVHNLVQVIICRVRHKLAALGAPDPIETVRAQGYRWKPGGGDDVAAQIAGSELPTAEILAGIYGVE